MKILMINDRGYEYGGGEIYLYNIKKELEALGHEVMVFSTTIKQKPSDTIKSDVTAIGFTGKVNRLFKLFNPFAYFKIKSVLRSFKPDVVHIHDLFTNLSPTILKPLKKYPTVMTVHNYFIVCPIGTKFISSTSSICTYDFGPECHTQKCINKREYVHQKLWRSQFNRLHNAIDLYIPCSTYGRNLLKHNGIANSVLLNHGIDTNIFASSPVPNSKNGLFIGRLVADKGVQVLIEAVSFIVKKHPTFTLTIVGDGPYRNDLEQLVARKKLTKQVTFTGKVPNKKIPAFIREAEIIYVPSIWPENSPITIYEVMASGRPVIGSNVGGIPDLVVDGKTGYLVKPGSHQNLASKTNDLLSHPARAKRFGAAGRKRVISRFTLSKHLSSLLAIYHKAIAKKHT